LSKIHKLKRERSAPVLFVTAERSEGRILMFSSQDLSCESRGAATEKKPRRARQLAKRR